jgi:hypothetical protein
VNIAVLLYVYQRELGWRDSWPARSRNGRIGDSLEYHQDVVTKDIVDRGVAVG